MLKNLHSADLNLLRVFVTVCECQGVTQAANRLGVAPSTVSTQLLDLEQRLNIKLCHRGRKGFSMTAQGTQVLNSAYRIFHQVEEFLYEIDSLQGCIVGSLKIGIIDNTHNHPQLKLHQVISDFQESFPKVELTIDVCSPDSLEESILNRKYDLGIGIRGKRLPNLVYKKLCSEKNVVCCARKHPLFNIKQKTINPELLAQSNWVYDFYRFPDKIPKANEPYTSTYVTNTESSLYLTLTGTHLSTLPKHYIEQLVNKGEIKILLEDTLSYAIELYIIRNSYRKNEKLISKFTQSLLSQITATE